MTSGSGTLLRLVCLVALSACSTQPANVAGAYSVSVTNETNGCNFASFTVGAQATNVSVTVTQSGASATADVTGLSAFALDGILGGHVFSGIVDGDAINLKLAGTAVMTSGNCTYTYNGEIQATLGGNSLLGQIDYTGATNNNSNCAGIQGCVTFQDFTGARPPP